MDNRIDNKILYSSIEHQIEKLKKQGLIIGNDELAFNALYTCGYFNLIKGYRDPYIIKTDNEIKYRSGVTFERIHSLYFLDKNLRNAVMASMQDFEEHLKAAIADTIASAFGTRPEQYLDYRNYRDRSVRNQQFSLNSIISRMTNIANNSGKNPVKHYREEHDCVPPWVLLKNIYFSTAANLVKYFKRAQRKEMVKKLYGNISEDDYYFFNKLMMATLFTCSEYRNLVAHGGRTYNYDAMNIINIWPESDSENFPKGFSLLLWLLNYLSYKNPYNILDQALAQEVNRHCTKFPEDVTYLGQTLNIDITKNEQ